MLARRIRSIARYAEPLENPWNPVVYPPEIVNIENGFHRIRDDDPVAFQRMRESVIRFQRATNSVYRRFDPHEFLPVRAFRDACVSCFPPGDAEAVFLSSGTGDADNRSKHYIYRLDVYKRSVITHFSMVFGKGPFTFLFYLPDSKRLSEQSSLIQMARFLMQAFGSNESGFVLDPSFNADNAIRSAGEQGHQLIVFGTAFGLLDWLDSKPVLLPPEAIVLETGGMKTYRREVSRSELHSRLAFGFGLQENRIRSEYGMCELLSQFYTQEDMLFYPPPWVQFAVLDPDRPEREVADGEPGALAIFDVANLFSVSGILTEDRAIRHGRGFNLLGRLSGAEIRGCNLLFEELE